MVVRIGEVLYWAGYLLAGLWLVGGSYAAYNTGSLSIGKFTALFIDAAVIWIICCGCRYLLVQEWVRKK